MPNSPEAEPEVDWLWHIHSNNPYAGFPADKFATDLQGWNHDSPIFEHVISTYRPSRWIEVGAWKGASAIRTAALMKRHHIPEPRLVCVDTWAGSVEMWLDRGFLASLAFKWGRPELYNTFLANVIRTGHNDVIIPFPVDASTAAKFFLHKGMVADVVYLDASHHYEDVASDLVAYWQVLRPGGIFFGDDYAGYCPGVIKAVTEFVERLKLPVNASFPLKFLLEKPSA